MGCVNIIFLAGISPVAHEYVGVLDQVDVEVARAVYDGEDVAQVGHDLDPVGPLHDLGAVVGAVDLNFFKKT